jgi:hypothetical protein
MPDDTLRALQDRTDAKIRYAAAHLGELHALDSLDGGDFDRAHQESFLLQLWGTRDAFLLELNAYYGAGLASEAVTGGRLRGALEQKGWKSAELTELHRLESAQDSWFSTLKALRDHISHVSAASRAYFLGGEDDHKVKLRDPRTGKEIADDFRVEYGRWLQNMRELIACLRASAMKTCGIT